LLQLLHAHAHTSQALALDIRAADVLHRPAIDNREPALELASLTSRQDLSFSLPLAHTISEAY
jgi:hypothetical protein